MTPRLLSGKRASPHADVESIRHRVACPEHDVKLFACFQPFNLTDLSLRGVGDVLARRVEQGIVRSVEGPYVLAEVRCLTRVRFGRDQELNRGYFASEIAGRAMQALSRAFRAMTLAI